MAFNNNFRQPLAYSSVNSYQGLAVPPVPPRNYGQSVQPSSGFGSNYGFSSLGGFGSSNFMNNGGYGGHYGYGGGYGYNNYGGFGGNQFGFGGMQPENRFIQMAEEGARPAFESFRSVMGALQSITWMFDSTFNAVYASYASVLGVADNFSKLRSMFARVFSAFSLIKALNWLYKRILKLIGVRSGDPSLDSVWASSLNESLTAGSKSSQSGMNWPAVALIGMLITVPYLIMKLISQIAPPSLSEDKWDPITIAGSRADVLYDFNAVAAPELSIRQGQMIMIAPKRFQPTAQGWLLACDKNKKTGLVPANYINIDGAANLKAVIPRSTFDGSQASFSGASSTSFPPATTFGSLPSASAQPSTNSFNNIIGITPPTAQFKAENFHQDFTKTGAKTAAASGATSSVVLTPTDVTTALSSSSEVSIPPVFSDETFFLADTDKSDLLCTRNIT